MEVIIIITAVAVVALALGYLALLGRLSDAELMSRYCVELTRSVADVVAQKSEAPTAEDLEQVLSLLENLPEKGDG
ncbi:hypothetical protein CPHO_07230 [Corynebacterium phocae]|uniref:Uncharacterized protein n=2 Tax=Corynebacterium phocae TaxID=161895 RepID=A0A1L7D3H3_9CORY|nr:hypothetical protein CPHO_07230 [Corynebacterium phocae]